MELKQVQVSPEVPIPRKINNTGYTESDTTTEEFYVERERNTNAITISKSDKWLSQYWKRGVSWKSCITFFFFFFFSFSILTAHHHFVLPQFTIIPSVVCALWLLIPLGKDDENGESHINFITYSIPFHGFYLIIAAIASILFFSLSHPSHHPAFVLTVSVFAAGVDIGMLFALRAYLTEYYQIISAASILIGLCSGLAPILGLTLLVNKEAKTLDIETEEKVFTLTASPSTDVFLFPSGINDHHMSEFDAKKYGHLEGMFVYKRELKEILKVFILKTLSILLVYIGFLWCQVFTYLYFSFSFSNTGRVLMSYAFSFSFAPLYLLGLFVTSKMYGESKSPRFITLCVLFSMELFYAAFYRNLFAKIDNFGVFFALVAGKLVADDVMRIAVPMSPFYHKLKLKYKLDKSNYETHLKTVCENYFSHAIAGTLTAVSYLVLTTLLRFNWNSEFYQYDPDKISDEKYYRLIYYYAISLVMEVVNNVVANEVIKRIFKLNMFHLGLIKFWRRRIVHILLIFITIHNVQDSYVALLEYS